MIKYLISRDSKGKLREAIVELSKNSEGHYCILRNTGCVGGKITSQPVIEITRTCQNRTWIQQATLEYNSVCKKYTDKGYKEIDVDPNSVSIEKLNEVVGKVVTDSNNIIRPMLAKQESKLTNRKILDKEWLCSRKLDGVRALFYWDGKEVRTASRGGEGYDPATTHLRENEELIGFFKENPTIILDGELYKHGKTLQQISGAARMEKNAYDCDWLQYWIYDMYDTANPDMTAEDRIDFLGRIDWMPVYDKTGDDMVCLLNHTTVSGEENIWKLHDQYVSEGFEGCVIRNPDKPYKPNGRTNDMLKFKNYKSEDFKVVGYELGLRGSEDMCFICELEDGRTFKAMPCGDRATKEEYVANFEEKYKGHMLECTYFNLSDEGIPTQPKGRIFRFDLE